MKAPSISMAPVEGSSQVKSLGYDPATKTLAVTFGTGGTYHYEGVSPESFANLKAAKSVGGHLHTHIKGKHKHTLIPQHKPEGKSK